MFGKMQWRAKGNRDPVAFQNLTARGKGFIGILNVSGNDRHTGFGHNKTYPFMNFSFHAGTLAGPFREKDDRRALLKPAQRFPHGPEIRSPSFNGKGIYSI